MNRRKLVFSIALGTLLTLGVLVGFSLNGDAALASAEAPEVVEQVDSGEGIRAQDTVSTAHVVVVFSGEKATVRSITWTGTISRITALELAGFDVDNSGDAVCNIEGDGCPSSNCWCDDNNWWQGVWNTGLTQWDSSGWPPADLRDGDVVGFHNGDAWAPPVLPAPSYVGALDALDWLQDQQQADGSFGNANGTSEVLMAVSANGVDASTWRHSPSLLANMISNGAGLANKNAAGVGKLAVALAAQDSCWPIGAQSPISYYNPISGTFDDDTLYQAWGILGTAALSETVPVSAVEALKDAQLPNGGWEWAVAQGSDTNSTALALQALIAAGEPVTSSSVVSGLNYLEYAQNDDGGFPYNPGSSYGTDSDTNSTAYVVQALVAAGEDPLTGTWAISNSNPISYLLSMQLPDGSFEWQKGYGTDQWATRQAIPALLQQAYPLEAINLQLCYGLAGTVESSSSTSSVAIQEIPDGISDVKMWVEGASDLYFGSTDASGHYTVSVPLTGTYTITPSKEDYVFSPTTRSVEVDGSPGDSVDVEAFSGKFLVYLPLVIRN
jgi:hypothetical protein